MTGNGYVEAFLELSQRVNDAGLMRRRYGFYWVMILSWTLSAGALLVGVAVLGESWFQLVLAALLGVVMAQLGFLGHEAAHQEIFASRRWNEWTARVLAGLFTGLSYGWWVDKHTRHHARPNQEGIDPDAAPGVLTFTPAGTERRTGLGARIGKYQGYYLVPLLFFEGFTLHVDSLWNVITAKRMAHRWTETLFMGVRIVGYLAFLFLVLPVDMALAFVGVQVAVFGFLLGGAFAPNHIGMPTVPQGVSLDFLRRQVRMSRSIRGGFWVHFFMGGLEYQVEHHLFPKTPRPNLAALQVMVREHCARYDIPYTQTTLLQAYATIIPYLNQVGRKHRDVFTCPLVRQYRG